MTRPTRPLCANPDHGRAVPAVARLTWPEGPYQPTTACAGCRDEQYRTATTPILIEPIPDAYGQCPTCRRTVLLRMDGTLRAHTWGGVLRCTGRHPLQTTGQEAS